MKLTIKVAALTDEDGALTPKGYDVLTSYAKQWLAGIRDLILESTHADLDEYFYDVREDVRTAHTFAGDGLAKSAAVFTIC
jgi:hypothetical protein